MKKFILTPVFIGLTLASFTGCNANKTATETKTVTKTSTELEKVGYSFGYISGENNRDMLNDLDMKAYIAGYKDAYAKKESNLSKEEMQKVLMAYKQRREGEYIEEQKALAATNLKKGNDWLLANAKKEGVKTTDSGLQYKVIKAGTGSSPKATDKVKVHYEGTLLDGTVFDSSKKRGEPIEFKLNEVIAGWTEGLQLMNEGAQYTLYIPANLAYGETGTHGIAPNSTLKFDVELIKINP